MKNCSQLLGHPSCPLLGSFWLYRKCRLSWSCWSIKGRIADVEPLWRCSTLQLGIFKDSRPWFCHPQVAHLVLKLAFSRRSGYEEGITWRVWGMSVEKETIYMVSLFKSGKNILGDLTSSHVQAKQQYT